MGEIKVISHDIRLDNLILRNFRGISDMSTLKFDNKLTVLIGDNTAGKTTILDAIAAALRNYTYQITKHEGAKQYEWNPYDLKNGTEIGSVELRCSYSYEFIEVVDENNTVNEVQEVEDKINGNLNLKLNFNSHGLKHKIDDYDSNENSEFIFGVKDKSLVNSLYRSLPVLLYFGTSDTRFVTKSKDERDSNIFQVYSDSLISKRFAIQEFHDWFYMIFKRAKLSEESNGYYLKLLNLIQDTILGTLNALNVQSLRYENLRIKFSEYDDFIAVDKINHDGNREYIAFSQLSSGERMIIGLITGITQRMIIGNPKIIDELFSEVKTTDINFSYLSGKGVVLIDEIDLHLHPKWQKKILPVLMDLFPKIQFVVTTHSPFVVQSVGRNFRNRIENGTVIDFQGDYAEDYDEVLLESFEIDSSLDEESSFLLKQLRDYFNQILSGEKSKNDLAFQNLIKTISQKDGIVKSILIIELSQFKQKLIDNGEI